MSEFEKSLKKIKKDLKFISNEFFKAAQIDDVFWQVQAIIKNNKEIDIPNAFFDLIADTYVDSMTIRLRRLIDKRRNVISLWRILEDLIKNVSFLTRDWYVNEICKNNELANNRFDSLVEPDSRCLSRKIIIEKQNELENTISEIEKYTNEYIAHMSGNIKEVTITFQDVRKSLKTVFNIIQWCYSLVFGAYLLGPVPTILGNWLKIFRIPWLKKGEPIPEYNHLDNI